jgi:hypothetical protein
VLRLHKDALPHTGGIEVRLEIAWQVIAPDGSESRVIQPSVIKRLTPLPKMLMSVDHLTSG